MCVCGEGSVRDPCLTAGCEFLSLEAMVLKLHLNARMKRLPAACCLTTLEPCLVQARVRGGLPVHAHVKAASIPMSTVIGLGSDSSLGPTAVKQYKQPVTINTPLK